LSGSLQVGFCEFTLSTVLFFLGGSKTTSDKFFTIPGKALFRIPIIIYRKKLTHPAGDEGDEGTFLLRKQSSSRKHSPFGG